MTANEHSSERDLQRKLEQATSLEPLDSERVDSETLEMREAWDAFRGTMQQVDSKLDQPIDTNALWEFVRQDDDRFAPPTVPQRSPRFRTRSSSSPLWLVLAATAATLAIAALGAWQLAGTGSGTGEPQVVVDDDPSPPSEIVPEIPQSEPAPREQIVQEDVPPQPLDNAVPPAIENLPSTTPDLYAWDDDLDDSLASAASTAHEIRYGWSHSSETYRYVSTRFESINDSLSDGSL